MADDYKPTDPTQTPVPPVNDTGTPPMGGGDQGGTPTPMTPVEPPAPNMPTPEPGVGTPEPVVPAGVPGTKPDKPATGGTY